MDFLTRGPQWCWGSCTKKSPSRLCSLDAAGSKRLGELPYYLENQV